MDKRRETKKWVPIANVPQIRAWDTLRKEYLSAGSVSIEIGPGPVPKMKIILDNCLDITFEERFRFEIHAGRVEQPDDDMEAVDNSPAAIWEHAARYWREPAENTPIGSPFWSKPVAHPESDWVLCEWEGELPIFCVSVLAKEGQGPPPDWIPEVNHG